MALFLNGFHKQATQFYYAFGVAFSGVDAFLRHQPRRSTACHTARRAAGRHQGLADFGQRRIRLRVQTGQQALVARRIQTPGWDGGAVRLPNHSCVGGATACR